SSCHGTVIPRQCNDPVNLWHQQLFRLTSKPPRPTNAGELLIQSLTRDTLQWFIKQRHKTFFLHTNNVVRRRNGVEQTTRRYSCSNAQFKGEMRRHDAFCTPELPVISYHVTTSFARHYQLFTIGVACL